MELKPASSVFLVGGLLLLSQGCAVIHGDIVGTDHAVVSGHVATITVSPTLKVEIPVNVALGDKVAEVAANAAVGYLKGLPGAISSLNRTEATQKGVDAGLKKAAERGQQVDRKELKEFVQQVVEKI